MAKVEILAQAFHPIYGSPLGTARTEVIDHETNVLFKDCNTLTDIAETYMRFWNRLTIAQLEMVLVQSIRWL